MFQGGFDDLHCERVAAVGRAVASRREGILAACCCQNSTNRDSVSQTFGTGEEVGFHTCPFVRPHPARASAAALYFVEEQQQSFFVADLAQEAESFGSDDTHTAVALDGLDHDGGGLCVDGIQQGFVVVDGHAIESVHGRTEAFEMLGFACGGDERERSTVEGVVEGYGSVSLRLSFVVVSSAREFEHGFVGLSARVAKEDGFGEGGGLQQLFGALFLRFDVEEV